MQITRWNTSPRSEREGVSSYLLLSPATVGSTHLSAALVELQPGAMQPSQHLDSEQCYFILEGGGLMTVGEEVQRVVAGDCILIPINTAFGLVNDGDEPLNYFAAAAPSFGEGILREWEPVGSTGDGSRGGR